MTSEVNRSTTRLLRQVTNFSSMVTLFTSYSHIHTFGVQLLFGYRCLTVFNVILLFLESDIYEDPSVRFESKKILQPDPTNMENYLVKNNFQSVFCLLQ